MKRGKTFYIGVIAMVLASIALLLAYVWIVPSTHPYVIQEHQGSLVNPVLAFSDSQALEHFTSEYVFYFLYTTKAYQLHALPSSEDYPRLAIVLDGVAYHAEVVDGIISVSTGASADVDITVYSTRTELIRLLRNPDAIPASFAAGTSWIEAHAPHATLFSKGYMRFYDSLYGSSITGNAIRILGS